MNSCKVREQLLAQEPMRPELKIEYERKWEAMFEKELASLHTRELNRTQRARFTVAGLVCLGLAVYLVYVGVISLAGLPWLSRWNFFAYALLQLAGGALCLRAAIQGSYHRKRLPAFVAGLASVFVVIHLAVSARLAGSMQAAPYLGTNLLLSSVLLLVVGLGFFLKNALEQSTLKVQEEVLRMQVQLAELNERLAKTAP